MKRSLPAEATSSQASNKKRAVTYGTFQKWQRDFDKELNTMSWLDCDTTMDSGKKMVEKLKCKICTRYESSIERRKNYSNKWIVGAESVRASNVRDHAQNEQHTQAMHLLRKDQAKASGLSATTYAPIAKALNKLPDDEKQRLRKKFDIAHFVATEKLSFLKYPQICHLEIHHGVNLGSSYLNETAGKSFVHYIAQSRRHELLEHLRNAKLFSLLLDGSTDKGNVDNELILVVWCDVNGSDERVHTRMSFFRVSRPQSVTADGLFTLVGHALQALGIQAINPSECIKLVGVGTDGASSNIAGMGLKGLIEKELPWIFWMWCLAHRLELSIKDALTGTSFDAIDDMLLKLYYLYEKSPKKCRELADIIFDLKDCLTFDDAGTRPVRASGSRWIAHKLNAMKRILSKYGAYTNHLAAMSEEARGPLRSKLQSYYKKWVDGKYLLGCAVFIDLLNPCAVCSKAMQSDEIDILSALTCLLKTVANTDKLSKLPLEQWPTYCATQKKCSEERGVKVYQCQELKRFSEAETFYKAHYTDYCSKITQCIKSRLAWSDLQQMRDIIFVLSTHGWEKALEEEDCLEAVDRLVEKFTLPLEGAGADTTEIHAEFLEIMQYAAQYFSLSTMDYRSVWWRLFNSYNSSEWSNALILVELLFSLPASNGKLERIFSTAKVIKTEKRSTLSNESLDDLLVLNSDKIPLQKFNPDHSIDLWWESKRRRPQQKPRKKYRQRLSIQSSTDTGSTATTSDSCDLVESEEESDSDSPTTCTLDDWDNWIDENENSSLESDCDSD